jgi:hypothetical protein
VREIVDVSLRRGDLQALTVGGSGNECGEKERERATRHE